MSCEFIKATSNKAREIMEEHHNDLSGTYFDRFPLGACGNTSVMLALYLNKNGIKNIEYVSGKIGSRSHGWLEYEDYIIDITSDQFDDGLGAVYVGRNKEFHNRFQDQSRSNPVISDCLTGCYDEFEILMNEKERGAKPISRCC